MNQCGQGALLTRSKGRFRADFCSLTAETVREEIPPPAGAAHLPPAALPSCLLEGHRAQTCPDRLPLTAAAFSP